MICLYPSLRSCRVTADLFFLRQPESAPDGTPLSFTLHGSAAAALEVTADGVFGAEASVPLEPCAPAAAEPSFRKFPHLRGCTVLRAAPGAIDAAAMLTQQLCVTAHAGSRLARVTGVQTQGVLDDLCAPPACGADQILSL